MAEEEFLAALVRLKDALDAAFGPAPTVLVVEPAYRAG